MDGALQQTFIAALPGDRVGYVMDRLEDAGGSAVLALHGPNGWELAAMFPASEARVAVAVEDDRVAQVHDDSRVDRFFDYLVQSGGTAVVERVAAKLLGDPRERQLV